VGFGGRRGGSRSKWGSPGNRKEAAVAVVTMKELLEAGVHFGHQTRRWNPKMRRFIFTERNGIYIIDLTKTMAGIDEAYRFVRDLVASGGAVLFVGTKKQISDAVEAEARRVAMPFVNFRWLGGMLTNFQTIHQRIVRMRELEAQEAQGILDEIPKKEALKLRHELGKLQRNLDGIRDLSRVPDAVFVVDTKKEETCVREARKLRIPLIGLVDTNCDPEEIDYVIPGNDDAIRSGGLLIRVIADAAAEGLKRRPPEVVAAAEAAAASGVQLTAGTEEPPAEWELMLIQQEADDDKGDEMVAEETASEGTPKKEPPEQKEPADQEQAAEAGDESVEVPPLLPDEPLEDEDIEEEVKSQYPDEDDRRKDGGKRK
jgi:small subunit ribosomal protein S2